MRRDDDCMGGVGWDGSRPNPKVGQQGMGVISLVQLLELMLKTQALEIQYHGLSTRITRE